MQVERLGPADYDRIVDLWQIAGLPIRAFGRDSKEAFSKQLASGIQTILGCEKDGELIGVIVATHDSRKGWINRLAVHPDCQRQGIGSLLIEAAEAELKRQGIEVIAALIFESNRGSIATFKSAGYEIDSRILYFSKRPGEEA